MSKSSIAKAILRDKSKKEKQQERRKIRQCVNCNTDMTINDNRKKGHMLVAYGMGIDKVCPICYRLLWSVICFIYRILSFED